MIAIINYGLGNVQAIANIYRKLDIPVVAATKPEELRSADKLILPGVGSFDWAMKRLDESGMRAELDHLVKEKGKPVLGICVGLQMMARASEEGERPGLGWLAADVKRFDDSTFTDKTHLPHMGWNDVQPRPHGGAFGKLFNGLEEPMRFYFLHSYYVVPDSHDSVLAETDYNGAFACSATTGSACGVQFHPEKSHQWGVQLLKNFAQL